ncbi:MAG: type IX secretion system motor protein PorM/GldM [Flavisolibacter sp.]
MSLPKEPRQKMINLMYLVLTAMLALNVSAEILNAFRTVDNSLIATNKTIHLSTDQVMTSLNDQKSDPQTMAKATIWYPKAEQARVATKEVYDYIQALRMKILGEAGFDPKANGDSSFKADNLDIATRIMVEEGEGKKLLAKLEAYKKKLYEIDPLIAAEFKNSLQVNTTIPPTQDKATGKTWESAYFHMVPTVAAITILSKFQNDVKTSENKVVTFCHEQVGKVVVRFDQFATILGQSSNYLMPGQEIEITAGVGAFSKAAAPSITINGQTAQLQEDGAARMKFAAGGIGNHSIPVHFVYTDQEGNPVKVDKTVQYTVGQANASIALDKMNVLYVGIANPISVAASGGGDDKTKVDISTGGRLEKTAAGKYNAFVNGGDKCTITVTVDGKVAGASEFRIRRIPTPTGTIGGYASGDNVNSGAFKAQSGVGAYIKDFPFDLTYTVTSFTISTDSDDGDIIEANVTGNAFGGNANAQNVLKQVKAGKTVYVDNIRATGQDGRSYKLPSLVYYIK